MRSSLSDLATRGTSRVPKVIGLGIALAGLACGAAQFAVADDVPPFAPGIITHMQQVTQFTDADHGSQPTPPVIPRFGVDLDAFHANMHTPTIRQLNPQPLPPGMQPGSGTGKLNITGSSGQGGGSGMGTVTPAIRKAGGNPLKSGAHQ